ncbi:sensor histidine kinase [Rubeoparvulum massiliense]|uniref:sensor histidine kinase n=1 Tax=Rubeoparvulum massiliense TaxID=1631346 RepID=UPI00065E5D63|nr:ATP-binding protein [Rubeoparvulum massiliense]
MKKLTLSLQQKLWLTISATFIIALLLSYGLVQFFYERLYVDGVENSLLYEGKQLVQEYHGGPVKEVLGEKVEWYNRISEAEIFLVENPRELSACLPFDIQYDSLISGEERAELLQGKALTKRSYEPRFERDILAVMVPLLEENRLAGVLYLYVPLASIQETLQNAQHILILSAILLIGIALLMGQRIASYLTRSLKSMEKIALEMAKGNFSDKITIPTEDEVGRLGMAFNIMSDALQSEDERKKEFLANVSHELRTPISYIQGYSEALLDGVVSSEEQEQKYLRLIRREAGRMERLVRDLLDLATLEGDYPLQQTALPFAQLITEVADTLLPHIEMKKQHLHLQLDHDVIVFGDEDRLEQVIHNLLTNANRYTPEGGMIKLSLRQEDEQALLAISDTGIGIPADDLPRIGERFFRVDKGRSRQEGGTGLGLAIVKQIVIRHHGTLEIQSEWQKGTTITIALPTFRGNVEEKK